MLKYVFIVLLVWVGWLGYQYHTKVQAANELMEKQSQEFYATDVEVLLKGAGKGYEYKTVDIEGKKFWLSWIIERKIESELELNGRVDFVELVPFTDMRLGSTFNAIMKLKYKKGP